MFSLAQPYGTDSEHALFSVCSLLRSRSVLTALPFCSLLRSRSVPRHIVEPLSLVPPRRPRPGTAGWRGDPPETSQIVDNPSPVVNSYTLTFDPNV